MWILNTTLFYCDFVIYTKVTSYNNNEMKAAHVPSLQQFNNANNKSQKCERKHNECKTVPLKVDTA